MPALQPQFQSSALRLPPPPALPALKTGPGCAHSLAADWPGTYCPACALDLIQHIECRLDPEKAAERAAWLKAHDLTAQARRSATAARYGYADFYPAKLTKMETAAKAARIAATERSVQTARARCRRTAHLPDDHQHKSFFVQRAEQTQVIMQRCLQSEQQESLLQAVHPTHPL